MSLDELIQAVTDALNGVPEPPHPRDGDCITYTDIIWTALSATDDLVPRRMLAYAWVLINDGSYLLFAHFVTIVNEQVVVDFTARQFDGAGNLPARWITFPDEYRVLLGNATNTVVVLDDPYGKPPARPSAQSVDS